MSETIDVLVIDDNELQLEFITHLFDSHGYTCHTMIDGKDALATILKIKPRVVLLDVMMPYVDGFTVLKSIRENEKLKDLPVIIYTSKAFPVDEKKAMRLGANAYIIKPVKGSVILEEIKKFL